MNKKILIVDDDPAALALLGRHLTMSGYEVLTASNGKDALRQLHAEGSPIVITDWMMPEMDGLQLCQAIRESEGAGFVYIIIVTAQMNKDRIVEAFEAGVDDFISKPYYQPELLARLKAGTRILALEADLAHQQRVLHKTNAELAVLNDRLERLATTDELTGLSNRREAMIRLEEAWAHAERHKSDLSCLMLDIDHFKSFNDTYGHDIGDVVLKHTARTLNSITRVGERAFRLGGEEFMVLCPSTTEPEAIMAGERLRKAIEMANLTVNNRPLKVTVSVGVAVRDVTSLTASDLLKDADQALYLAKRSGRNRVCSTSQLASEVFGTAGATLETAGTIAL